MGSFFSLLTDSSQFHARIPPLSGRWLPTSAQLSVTKTVPEDRSVGTGGLLRLPGRTIFLLTSVSYFLELASFPRVGSPLSCAARAGLPPLEQRAGGGRPRDRPQSHLAFSEPEHIL